MVTSETCLSAERRVDSSRLIVAALTLVVSVILLLYIVLFHTRDAATANRIFGTSLLLMLVVSAGLYRFRELQRQKDAWLATASALNLQCRLSKNPFQLRTIVAGTYRGRPIQISISRDTVGRIPVTYIDMGVRQRSDAKFRIWGPFSESEVSAEAPSGCFDNAKRFGTHKSFFAYANPIQISARLFPPNIWQRLQRINHPINISLIDQTLSFEQPGITHDSAELTSYVELLSEIAFVITEWEVTSRMNIE